MTQIPPSSQSAPIDEFRVLWTAQKKQKLKKWHDGFLRLHTFNKRMLVYDETRNLVTDMYLRHQESLSEGDELEFENHLITVQDFMGTVIQDLMPIMSPALQRRQAKQSTSAASPLVRRQILYPPQRNMASPSPQVQARPRPLANPVPVGIPPHMSIPQRAMNPRTLITPPQPHTPVQRRPAGQTGLGGTVRPPRIYPPSVPPIIQGRDRDFRAGPETQSPPPEQVLDTPIRPRPVTSRGGSASISRPETGFVKRLSSSPQVRREMPEPATAFPQANRGRRPETQSFRSPTISVQDSRPKPSRQTPPQETHTAPNIANPSDMQQRQQQNDMPPPPTLFSRPNKKRNSTNITTTLPPSPETPARRKSNILPHKRPSPSPPPDIDMRDGEEGEVQKIAATSTLCLASQKRNKLMCQRPSPVPKNRPRKGLNDEPPPPTTLARRAIKRSAAVAAGVYDNRGIPRFPETGVIDLEEEGNDPKNSSKSRIGKRREEGKKQGEGREEGEGEREEPPNIPPNPPPGNLNIKPLLDKFRFNPSNKPTTTAPPHIPAAAASVVTNNILPKNGHHQIPDVDDIGDNTELENDENENIGPWSKEAFDLFEWRPPPPPPSVHPPGVS